MDTDLQKLRETLADVTELLFLTNNDDSGDLTSLKRNLEELITLKELEEKKQVASAAVQPVISSEDEESPSQKHVEKLDIFTGVPDDDLPGANALLSYAERIN